MLKLNRKVTYKRVELLYNFIDIILHHNVNCMKRIIYAIINYDKVLEIFS